SREVFGSGAVPAFLAAAAELRGEVKPAGRDQRADPRRTAELVRRKGDEIGIERAGAEGELACRLNGVAMEYRAMFTRYGGDFRHGLDHPGLVVCKHHGYQGGSWMGSQKPVGRLEHDQAASIDRNGFRRGSRMTDRIVLDRRDKDAVAAGAKHRKMVRF